MDHPTCNYDCSTTYIKTRENQFSYRYCFAISLQKNLEKIIGILLWAASLVHHVRFLLTSLYRDLYSIPATNYNVKPTEWEYFLNLLNDCATITVHNHLHLPIGSKVVEFKHTPISSSSQLPRDIPIDMLGFDLETQIATRDVCQIHRRKLYFGPNGLYYRF